MLPRGLGKFGEGNGFRQQRGLTAGEGEGKGFRQRKGGERKLPRNLELASQRDAAGLEEDGRAGQEALLRAVGNVVRIQFLEHRKCWIHGGSRFGRRRKRMVVVLSFCWMQTAARNSFGSREWSSPLSH